MSTEVASVADQCCIYSRSVYNRYQRALAVSDTAAGDTSSVIDGRTPVSSRISSISAACSQRPRRCHQRSVMLCTVEERSFSRRQQIISFSVDLIKTGSWLTIQCIMLSVC